MDSDDEQIGTKNKAGKKTKGRKKSTATTNSTTTGKPTTKSTTKKSTKGRRIKNVLESDTDDDLNDKKSTATNKKQKLNESKDEKADNDLFTTLDVDHKLTDLTSSAISTQLFTGTSRLNVPLLHDNKPLNWNHKINLIGEKSLEQRVHLCDICFEPILFYGRLIPCKHVFCYDCAMQINQQDKLTSTSSGCCLNCNERIARIERVELNSMYICNHDKTCKRTYLSQRDLFAHIQHRHTKKEKSNSSEKSLKLRTTTHPFNNSKDEFQTSSFVQKSTHHHHHHYPQPSLHTLQWTSALAAAASNATGNGGQFVPPNANFKFSSGSLNNFNRNYIP